MQGAYDLNMLNILLLKRSVLSSISQGIGQIFFASVFIAPLLNEKADFTVPLYGLTLSVVFWGVSVVVAKE